MVVTKKIYEVPNILCQMKLEGHYSPIEDVTVDETTVISASRDNTIRIWDKQTGECLNILKGHNNTVTSVAIQDNTLISGSLDTSVRVWDKSSGECMQVLEGHSEGVLDVAIEDDTVASASEDCTVKLWDLNNGTCTNTLKGHDRKVSAVKFSDGVVVSGSWDHAVKIWDKSSGECLNTLLEHGDAIECISVNRTKIISGDQANTIIVWDLKTRKELRKLLGHTRMIMDLVLDGNMAYSCAKDKTIRQWDVNTGVCLKKLEGHTDAVLGLATMDNLVVSSSADGTIRIWDDRSENSIKTLRGHTDEILAIDIDEDTLISAGKDGLIKVWDLKNLTHVKDIPIPYKSWVWGLALQNNKAVASSDDGTYRIIDIKTGELIQALEGHSSATYRVVADEDIIVTASWDNTVRVWDFDTGNLRQILKGHTYSPYSPAITDDKKIVTGGSDSTMRVWDLNGNTLHVLKGHKDEIFHIATEGNLVVSASADKSIKAFNTNTGELITTLEGHKDQVLTIQIKNGIVFSGSLDHTIKIWDLNAGVCLNTLEGHMEGVKDLRVYKDKLISASYDNTMRVWEIGHYINQDEQTTTCETTTDQDILVAQIQMGSTYNQLPKKLGSPDLTRVIYGLEPIDLRSLYDINAPILPTIRGLAKNWRKLGRIGHAPWLVQLFDLIENEEIELEAEETLKTVLNDFLVGLSESENLYWLGLLRTLGPNPSLLLPKKWSFNLAFSGQGPAPLEEFEWHPLGPGINNVDLEDRTETALVFKATIENIPEWVMPLIKAIVVQFKDDRGDIQDVQFNNFIIDKEGNWSDIAMFKIDAGYRLEPIAIIDVTDIDIIFNSTLKPDFRGSEIIDEIRSELDGFKQEILQIIETNSEAGGDLANQLKSSISHLRKEELKEYTFKDLKNSARAKSIFNLVRNRFKEPRFGTIKVKIGGSKAFMDKFLEFLQPKFIFISSGTTIASSILLILTYAVIFNPDINLMGFEFNIFGDVFTSTEIIVYILVYGFLILFLVTSITSWIRYQRKKKKQKV
jgi:WD40 repeat protein